MAKKQNHDDSRTQEEIDQISEVISRMVWIKGLAPVGNRDFVNANYTYQKKFTPTAIAAAYWYVRDTYCDYDGELLTRPIVKKANIVTKDIHAAMIERACDEWSASEFRKLTQYFVTNFSQWKVGLETIRERGVNNFDHLMALLPHLHDSSSPILRRGTL